VRLQFRKGLGRQLQVEQAHHRQQESSFYVDQVIFSCFSAGRAKNYSDSLKLLGCIFNSGVWLEFWGAGTRILVLELKDHSPAV